MVPLTVYLFSLEEQLSYIYRQVNYAIRGIIGWRFVIAMLGGFGGPVPAQVDYQTQIQPLFDRYCVGCHACFDAPCQLDLTSGAGVLRGASKVAVYDGTRLDASKPSRLNIDAHTPADWETRGFFSVTRKHEDVAPILLQLLALKKAHPLRPGDALPEDIDIGIRRTNRCANGEEIGNFSEERPQLGMPFALPGLNDSELGLLANWLEAGAPVTPAEMSLTSSERRQIERWEHWLNGGGARRAIVARWLNEHWILARLYFDAARSGNFFRLVRSRTPPGQTIDEIATRRSNDAPGGPFFYRFQVQDGTIVYKTQIPFALNGQLLEKIDRDFLGGDWQLGRVPGYSEDERANPFTTFAPIPADVRYRFMLEHAEYFVRTFIRGPVCRGQLATDVIRDHFWVMFESPAHERFVTDLAYHTEVAPLLGMPNVEAGFFEGAEAWLETKDSLNTYWEKRRKRLAAQMPTGPTWETIWDGGGDNKNALLTVIRHHDSATVKRGWLGQVPLTVWWLDYPLFERSYYNLVVNFDVFGNAAHQAQTRLYFDLIRNGAEQNFLRLLPGDARQTLLDEWYQGSGDLKLWFSYQSIDTKIPTAISLPKQQPYQTLLDRLLQRFAGLNATPDLINRCEGNCSGRFESQLARLSNVPTAQMPAIGLLPDASLLLLTDAEQKPALYTLMRNRRHTNVAFILGESLRYQPEKDTLTVVPGVATGYPNFIFAVPTRELASFVAALRDHTMGDLQLFTDAVIDRWGVRRSAPEIWTRFHQVTAFLRHTDPIAAGILDINRYVDF